MWMGELRVEAQDPSFSQAYANPLYLSPSFTGLTNGSRVALSYRDQWPGIPNAFKTYSFSYDHFFPNYKSGLGLLLLRDDRGGGQLVTQDVGFLYSYEIEVFHDIYVRPGIQFKYAERKIDPSKMFFGDQYGVDGKPLPGSIASFDQVSYKRFDASASGMIYSDNFWFGFSLDHLVKANVGFTDMESNVPIRTNVFGGYKYMYLERYKNRDEQSVTLALNYFNQFFQQVDAGVYWYVYPFEVGLIYRGVPILSDKDHPYNDALIMMFGLNLGPARISYSYDLTTSKLAGISNGANEFSLTYRFNQSFQKRTSRGAIPCSGSGMLTNTGTKYRSKQRKIF
jgi:type IX secretion system PorP/SprF family membrane protein